MKYLALAPMLFLAIPAYAADAEKPAPKPTIESLQAGVTEDEQKIKELTAAVQGAVQQRDVAQKALNDLQLQTYVAGQAPRPKKESAPANGAAK